MSQRMIRIEFDPTAADELIEAIIEKDADAVGDALDQALAFKGPAGQVLEGIDGVLFDALADVLIEKGPVIAEKLVERIKRRQG